MGVEEDPTVPSRLALSPELAEALRNWQPQQAPSIAQAAALSDQGDVAASLVAAWMYQQQNWPEGVPHARRVVEAGYSGGHTIVFYVQNTLGDPARQPDALALIQGLSAGPLTFPGIDLMPNVHALVTQNNLPLAEELLNAILLPQPAGARRAWEKMVEDVEPVVARIQSVEAAANLARDQATAQITEWTAELESERNDTKQLVEQARGYSHEAAGLALAKEYEDQAKAEQDRADGYTRWSLIAAVAAAVFSILVAVLVAAQ